MRHSLRDDQSIFTRVIKCFERNQNVATVAQIQALAGYECCQLLDRLREEGRVRIVARCPAKYELLSIPALPVEPVATKKRARRAESETLSAMEQHLKQWGIGA